MGIVHIRVDDRLIHGQVATMWTYYLHVNRIMVIDDKASSDDFLKTSLKLAVPQGIALSVLSVDKAAQRINDGIYNAQRVFVILGGVETLYRLINAKVCIKEVNLGNITKTEGKVKICPTVSVTYKEAEKLLELNKKGIKIIYQLIPQHDAENLAGALKKTIGG